VTNERTAYKWIALSNTTLGVLLVAMNGSILLISLPDIFRGIGIDPLAPSNTSYLLWTILSYLVVSAVLVVGMGRIGDLYGRVRIYNLGFAVFTVASILLSITWMHGHAAALWIIGMRVVAAVGGAMLSANSSAIVTDAFPVEQRGLALGINTVAAIAGAFVGLMAGGVLAPISWRLVFVFSVPVGLFGTVWAYRRLVDLSPRHARTMDWWGNVTFALGLVSIMVGITYGIQPYGGHLMGWTSPLVIATILGGIAVLGVFVAIEKRVEAPMFDLTLFRSRAFSAGCIATFLASMGRGAMQFILVIWLQGVWLPLHGYDFSETPLYAGLAMSPMLLGIIAAGPICGWLSDRYGARPLATTGMLLAGGSFLALGALPADFAFPTFCVLLLVHGIGMGMFSPPNRASIMNSLPPHARGAGSGMMSTFLNSAQVLSIGVFFSLLVVGLSSGLPSAIHDGLIAHGVPAAEASRVAGLPPVSSLFASFLGYNPMETLLGPHALASLPDGQAAVMTGRSFFPNLMAGPFHHALGIAFGFAFAACMVAALASGLRGGHAPAAGRDEPVPPAEAVATLESV